MNIHKKGFIRINGEFFRGQILGLKDLYKVFTPTAIEQDFSYNSEVYKVYGVSDQFDEIKEGDLIPEYHATLEKTERDENYIVVINKANNN